MWQGVGENTVCRFALHLPESVSLTLRNLNRTRRPPSTLLSYNGGGEYREKIDLECHAGGWNCFR